MQHFCRVFRIGCSREEREEGNDFPVPDMFKQQQERTAEQQAIQPTEFTRERGLFRTNGQRFLSAFRLFRLGLFFLRTHNELRHGGDDRLRGRNCKTSHKITPFSGNQKRHMSPAGSLYLHDISVFLIACLLGALRRGRRLPVTVSAFILHRLRPFVNSFLHFLQGAPRPARPPPRPVPKARCRVLRPQCYCIDSRGSEDAPLRFLRWRSPCVA